MHAFKDDTVENIQRCRPHYQNAHCMGEGVPEIQPKYKCVATADYSKIQIIPRTSSTERESSRDFLQLPIASVYAGEKERISRKRKNPVGIKWVRKRKKKKKEKCDITSLYRISGSGTRVCSGFEYSILKHLSWASITVLSVSFPARSKVGTHENILHFPPRFTRCIL